MPVIVVANPKGGVGKSTLTTNIAGYWARRCHAVMLGDIDVQQSAAMWLQTRPDSLPVIRPWEIDDQKVAKPPKGTTHVVLDTPAGIKGKRMEAALKIADLILVPLQPSMFDITPTREFVDDLLAHKRSEKVKVAVVGNRVKENTKAAEHLQAFLATLSVPLLGMLRDTQNYTHLAAHGLSLWDVPESRVEKDLGQWAQITAWLDRG